jgi:hypothetical protein
MPFSLLIGIYLIIRHFCHPKMLENKNLLYFVYKIQPAPMSFSPLTGDIPYVKAFPSPYKVV